MIINNPIGSDLANTQFQNVVAYASNFWQNYIRDDAEVELVRDWGNLNGQIADYEHNTWSPDTVTIDTNQARYIDNSPWYAGEYNGGIQEGVSPLEQGRLPETVSW